MSGNGNSHGPLSPDERRQIEFERRKAEWDRSEAEKKAAFNKAAELIETERHDDIEIRAVALVPNDPELLRASVTEIAKALAGRGVRNGNFQFGDHRGVIEQGVLKARDDEKSRLEQEVARDMAAQVEKASAPLHDPTPQTPQAANEGILTPSVVEQWKPTALEVCGSTDKRLPPIGPVTPTPPAPPAQALKVPISQQQGTSGPLGANEIHQRFGNPELQARYEQDNRRREQDVKSAPLSLDAATRGASLGNVPADPANVAPNSGLPDRYKTSEIKRRAAEEEARRANDPTYSPGRSGGRGR